MSASSTITAENKAATARVAVAKGVRDYHPEEVAARDAMFATIQREFQLYGAVPIDTPVFELRETLMGKYGEDSKLIYDLADQGGQMLSLRYDLTVPFARYVACHNIQSMKRYHIAKVYRRDNPAMTRGRYREFYQCDYDSAGDTMSRLPDAECLQIMSSIMRSLAVGEFQIKTSHRGLLDGFFEIAGVSEDKIRAISSAIDKLDKSPWSEVEAEMMEKGLDATTCAKIQTYVTIRGPMAVVLQQLQQDLPLMQSTRAVAAIHDLQEIMGYTDSMGCTGDIVLDLSLARGLDYYTGIIYECVLTKGDIGSVCAGGRYDNLIGQFAGSRIPAVGFSIGVDRLMSACQKQHFSPTDVMMVYREPQHITPMLNLAATLRLKGIRVSTEYDAYLRNNQLKRHIRRAVEAAIPFMILVGERDDCLILKNISANTQQEYDAANPDLVVAAIQSTLNLNAKWI